MVVQQTGKALRIIEKSMSDRPLLVGVSGGVDSLALIYILNELNLPAIVAHFNHKLRADADDDEVFVKNTAATLNYPYLAGSVDVGKMAVQRKLSLETAARQARYKFLFDQAAAIGARAVVTAHTADDQVETVLMHLLRGSGFSALAGMRPRTVLMEFSREIPLIRPLLGIWRNDLEAYCRTKGLQPRYDATNLDPTYQRNRIRTELIPLLSDYNGQIKDRLLGLSENVQASLDILNDAVTQADRDSLVDASEGFRRYALEKLANLSEGMQLELIHRSVKEIQPNSDNVDREAYLRAKELIEFPHPPRRVDLANGISASIDRGEFSIYKIGRFETGVHWPVASLRDGLVLTVPGRVDLENGWQINADWVNLDDKPFPAAGDSNPNTVILNGENLVLPFVVRRKKPGDRFQPFGMQEGSQTIGDFFTNNKMPRVARSGWPLILSGEKIIWVAGYRMAESCRVQANNRKLIRLQLVKTS